MSFLEIRFPESISFESSSKIQFHTSIVTTKSGLEQRNIDWNLARMQFNIIQGIKTKQELNEVQSFFRNVKGCGYGFRFKDWSDYNATKTIIGNGNDENKIFYLTKSYQNGKYYYVRKITKPVVNTIKIYINDVETKDFEVNYTIGQIVFNTPPANNSVILASFEFDTPVRFNNDVLEISMETIHTGIVKNIDLIEII